MGLEKYRTRHQLFTVVVCLVTGLLLGGLGIHLYEHRNGAGGALSALEPALAVGEKHGPNIPEMDAATATAATTASEAAAATSIPSIAPSDKHTSAGSRSQSHGLQQLWIANNILDSTMRSCFSSDCYNFAFDPSPEDVAAGVKTIGTTSTIERIGFLAPDLRGMESLLKVRVSVCVGWLSLCLCLLLSLTFTNPLLHPFPPPPPSLLATGQGREKRFAQRPGGVSGHARAAVRLRQEPRLDAYRTLRAASGSAGRVSSATPGPGLWRY